MKLGIVIPFKSKVVSRDWQVASRCLQSTLHSLDRQSSSAWCATVVGHEKPDFSWEAFSDQITWLTSTQELPPLSEGETSYRTIKGFDRILDKNRKTSQGMRHLKKQGVTDWFVLDADDLVHMDFVRTLTCLPRQSGWLIRSGYLWYQDLQRWMPSDQMLNLCGSTAVISSSMFEVPSASCDEELGKIPWCRMSHSDMESFLLPHLAGADPNFPLRAVAYTLSHGDNCSDEFRDSMMARAKLWIKKRLQTRKLNREFCESFGIEKQLINAKQNRWGFS